MNALFARAPAGVRRPAVAGRFYPSEPNALRDLVMDLLASVPSVTGPAPKALIVPHAGYRFSGPVAASGYARLRPARNVIKRVVLLGPSHFVALPGIALSTAEAFATPLGVVPLDREFADRLTALRPVRRSDEAHRHEHALEVQLPFLQVVLDHFTLVPLIVGEATAADIAQALEAVWGGPETCLVISSDLSHYLDTDSARRLDQTTADAIESLSPKLIGEDQACGRVPIRGLLQAAAAHELHASTIDLRNSGDTGGPRERVVGYGAFGFYTPL